MPPMLLLPVLWAQLQQPCRIWSVREALSYSGLCDVKREQGTTSLTAPHSLTGEQQTVEISPKGRRYVTVRGLTPQGEEKPWGEARKVGKSCWVGSDFGLCL
tara:strand:+ start:2340 stop:2645 length:306 start_codon:yes stop_codon:yes gene_type:complete